MRSRKCNLAGVYPAESGVWSNKRGWWCVDAVSKFLKNTSVRSLLVSHCSLSLSSVLFLLPLWQVCTCSSPPLLPARVAWWWQNKSSPDVQHLQQPRTCFDRAEISASARCWCHHTLERNRRGAGSCLPLAEMQIKVWRPGLAEGGVWVPLSASWLWRRTKGKNIPGNIAFPISAGRLIECEVFMAVQGAKLPPPCSPEPQPWDLMPKILPATGSCLHKYPHSLWESKFHSKWGKKKHFLWGVSLAPLGRGKSIEHNTSHSESREIQAF